MNALQYNNSKLTELHGDFREFKGIIDTKVDTLETQAKSDKFWGRVSNVAVLPVVAALHQIANHFGLIK